MAFTVQASEPVPSDVEEILRELPEWFGIEEALVDYVDQAAKLPTYTATVDGDVQGVCLIRHHNRFSAETSLLAVRRKFHRKGLGRALMAAAEQDAKAQGLELYGWTGSPGMAGTAATAAKHPRMLPTAPTGIRRSAATSDSQVLEETAIRAPQIATNAVVMVGVACA